MKMLIGGKSRKIHVGARGGKYYMKGGLKKYIKIQGGNFTQYYYRSRQKYGERDINSTLYTMGVLFLILGVPMPDIAKYVDLFGNDFDLKSLRYDKNKDRNQEKDAKNAMIKGLSGYDSDEIKQVIINNLLEVVNNGQIVFDKYIISAPGTNIETIIEFKKENKKGNSNENLYDMGIVSNNNAGVSNNNAGVNNNAGGNNKNKSHKKANNKKATNKKATN